MLLDVLCAPDVGEKLIKLSLADPDQKLRAHTPVTLQVDYSACDPRGVDIPLVFTVTSGSSRASYKRVLYSRVAPARLIFTPREGGRHTVRLGEVYHQQWWGYIRLDIEGGRLGEGTLV